jgi:hypothetical protein
MTDDLIPVRLPAALYRRVETSLSTLGYPSVEAFVAHAVRAALGTAEPVPAPDPQEEAQIVERLRRLGYID